MFEPWHLELLAECRAGRLGTIAGDGRPHLVPVCYAVVEGEVVIPIDEKPKRSLRLTRIQNIERDPRVSLLVDRYSDDWEQLAWLRIDGRATVLERGGEAAGAVAALRDRYVQYRAMPLEDLPLIRIEPEALTGWRWRS